MSAASLTQVFRILPPWSTPGVRPRPRPRHTPAAKCNDIKALKAEPSSLARSPWVSVSDSGLMDSLAAVDFKAPPKREKNIAAAAALLVLQVQAQTRHIAHQGRQVRPAPLYTHTHTTTRRACLNLSQSRGNPGNAARSAPPLRRAPWRPLHRAHRPALTPRRPWRSARPRRSTIAALRSTG